MLARSDEHVCTSLLAGLTHEIYALKCLLEATMALGPQPGTDGLRKEMLIAAHEMASELDEQAQKIADGRVESETVQ